jgi:hypothetical protein
VYKGEESELMKKTELQVSSLKSCENWAESLHWSQIFESGEKEYPQRGDEYEWFVPVLMGLTKAYFLPTLTLCTVHKIKLKRDEDTIEAESEIPSL